MKLSEQLENLQSEVSGENAKAEIGLTDLILLFPHKGPAFVTFLLCFPFLLPIPLPGLSVLFGFWIALIGISIIVGRPPWIPQWVVKKRVPKQKIITLLTKVIPWVKKVEKYFKPRLPLLSRPLFQKFSACLMVMEGVLLGLPLPPGTNFPPAFGMIFLSLGLLEEDGIATLIGYFLFLVNLVFFYLFITLGYEGIQRIIR